MELGPIADGHKMAFSERARFRTGFMTTGRDWWFVSWVTQESDKSTKVWFIYPDNFRSLIDYLDVNVLPVATNYAIASVADKVIPTDSLGSELGSTKAALGKIGSFDANFMKEGFQEIWPAFKLELSQWLKKEGEEGLEATAANFAAKKITGAVASNLESNGGTSGFKSHMLTSDDKADGIGILLTNEEVSFFSKSGKSTTPAHAWQTFKPKEITDVVYRNARVKVKNNTSHRLECVLVGHKYSDIYMNSGIFRNLEKGQVATESFIAEFREH